MLPTIELAQVNHAPALVYRYEAELKPGVPTHGVVQMEVDERGAISRILAVAAPSKLARFFDALEGSGSP